MTGTRPLFRPRRSEAGLLFGPGLDKLGVPVAGLVLVGAAALPFATFRANRIVPGEARSILTALPEGAAAALIALLAAAALVALLRAPRRLRLAMSLAALAGLALGIGLAGSTLTPPGNTYARVSPGSGFWLLVFAFALAAVDALTRLRLGPGWRLVALALAVLALALVLGSGLWDELSMLKEYETRAAAFWREARRHVVLAFGSLALAILTGIPLGVLCQRARSLRGPVLNLLNMIQTIPSLALFGLLIAPLAWLAANLPGAAGIGVSGIGAAPALLALYAYSLLPVVSNTVVGLDGVPLPARDAATGMGMTEAQKLLRVEAPLALPVILTGIRIVLVQNVGLATIAALIGGGGFGVFVFQGMGQTATDLILLGAIPTVVLAFVCAIVLDALIEMSEPPGRGRTAR